MPEASSHGTSLTTGAPRRTGTGCTAAVDVDTIRRTYDALLWASAAVPSEERERLSGLLLGHVQLLLPELDGYAPRMRGEQQHTAVHVIAQTRRILENGIGTSWRDIWDLATQCRALLTLYEHPGLLKRQTAKGGSTEAQS